MTNKTAKKQNKKPVAQNKEVAPMAQVKQAPKGKKPVNKKVKKANYAKKPANFKKKPVMKVEKVKVTAPAMEKPIVIPEAIPAPAAVVKKHDWKRLAAKSVLALIIAFFALLLLF